MWRGWGSGGGGVGGGVKTCVRYFSRKRAENLRKINPKVPYPEATSIAQSLYSVFKQQGPLTISGAWTNAQEAGVSGINSKTHMKILLKWMRGKKMLRQVCHHVGSNKKFLLCTPEDTSELATKSTEVKLQTAKPKIGRKKVRK